MIHAVLICEPAYRCPRSFAYPNSQYLWCGTSNQILYTSISIRTNSHPEDILTYHLSTSYFMQFPGRT